MDSFTVRMKGLEKKAMKEAEDNVFTKYDFEHKIEKLI